MQYFIGPLVGSFTELDQLTLSQAGPSHFQLWISASALSTFSSKVAPIHTGDAAEITGVEGAEGSTKVISFVLTKHSLPWAAILISEYFPFDKLPILTLPPATERVVDFSSPLNL